jgi:antitoxin VapB
VGLNIKNAEVERLAAEVAIMAKESKTEAIRRALLDRRERLLSIRPTADKGARLERFLREEVWPHIPADVRGRGISKAEREEILGYGPDGF